MGTPKGTGGMRGHMLGTWRGHEEDHKGMGGHMEGTQRHMVGTGGDKGGS